MSTVSTATGPFIKASNQLPIRPLGSADWEMFRYWAEYAVKSHGQGNEGLLRIKKISEETWRAELSQTEWKYFATFDGNTIIGLGKVNRVMLRSMVHDVNIEIAQEYRGRGLGTNMLVAIKDYVANNYPGEDVVARIRINNLSSRRSAEKAGLNYTGIVERDTSENQGFMVYTSSFQARALDMNQQDLSASL